MGLLKAVLTAPVMLPMNGTLWVAGQIAETAEAEFRSPAAIRRALDTLEQRLLAGEIDEEAFEAEELVLLRRMEQTR